MRTPEYLDMIREKLRLPSDYALQKPLQVSKTQVSNYRNGKEFFSDVIAVRVAALCDIRAERVLVESHLEKAKTPEERAVWESILEKISESFKRHLLGSWQGVERRSMTLQ